MTTEINLAGMDQDRLRLAAQAAARRFKNTWIEFGAVLIRVRDTEAWRTWGFDSFESYCSKELHIRHKTAQKLTASFGFLQRHEPEVAASEMRVPNSFVTPDAHFGGQALLDTMASREESMVYGTQPLAEEDEAGQKRGRRMPGFETISVLAGAEARGQLKDEDYAALRERIWGDNSAGEGMALAREIKERFSEPKPQPTEGLRVKKCVQTARRLADELMALTSVDDALKAAAESLAQQLSDFQNQRELN